ncbi:Cysteine desulfurase [Georgfuchsia toluolica]|uniref:Cysteine desulfurase n=1 Tax=Georgfuchsia toluolica TaxID=424218 RepID=A0A916N2A2_9PROT|nr:cysteine desulfurase [Georgfuchsia toluolica]CAG4883629.1 Cysteine desulfurase [Georgfuchsia toluolica]
MSFDAAALRAEFPLLASATMPLHYLDSAATSQIHHAALDAMVRHETTARANVMRGTYRLAEAATEAYETARTQAARFLNAAAPDEIVFTAGATAALNLVAYAFGGTLRPGDEVVISLAEHHSNFVPWQMLRDRAGICLKFLPLTAEGRIDSAALPALVTSRCRLIAVTHCSNVTGAVSDVAAIVAAARAVGARVLLDGAQQVQHGPADVQALGIDFYAFSGHKCYGPNGIGVLWGRADALDCLPPFQGGGGMVGEVTPEATSFAMPPYRFEAGTPPIAQAVGLGAALDWMVTLPWPAIHVHEQALLQRLLAGLATRPQVRVLGPADLTARQPIVAFNLAGLHPHDVCQVLDRHGVALRGGHHCAQPLMRHFGVDGTNRASIAPYNTTSDIDALLAGLDDAIEVLA